MRIWIISDTHFYHRNIIKFQNRPENHNELMISNWAKMVSHNDTIIHLGDVIFGAEKFQRLSSLMGSLPGKKILCRGNHDSESADFYMNAGFDFVCDYFVMNGIAFSHVPLTPLPDNITMNIHGHFHSSSHRSEEQKRTGKPPKFYDGKYYHEHRSKYRLIHIEGTFAPIPIEEITEEFDNKNSFLKY